MDPLSMTASASALIERLSAIVEITTTLLRSHAEAHDTLAPANQEILALKQCAERIVDLADSPATAGVAEEVAQNTAGIINNCWLVSSEFEECLNEEELAPSSPSSEATQLPQRPPKSEYCRCLALHRSGLAAAVDLMRWSISGSRTRNPLFFEESDIRNSRVGTDMPRIVAYLCSARVEVYQMIKAHLKHSDSGTLRKSCVSLAILLDGLSNYAGTAYESFNADSRTEFSWAPNDEIPRSEVSVVGFAERERYHRSNTEILPPPWVLSAADNVDLRPMKRRFKPRRRVRGAGGNGKHVRTSSNDTVYMSHEAWYNDAIRRSVISEFIEEGGSVDSIFVLETPDKPDDKTIVNNTNALCEAIMSEDETWLQDLLVNRLAEPNPPRTGMLAIELALQWNLQATTMLVHFGADLLASRNAPVDRGVLDSPSSPFKRFLEGSPTLISSTLYAMVRMKLPFESFRVMVKFLLDHGVATEDTFHITPFGDYTAHTHTALSVSITEGSDKSVASFLMENGAKPIYSGTSKGVLQPLHSAVWDNRCEIVELLISRGARCDQAFDIYFGQVVSWRVQSLPWEREVIANPTYPNGYHIDAKTFLLQLDTFRNGEKIRDDQRENLYRALTGRQLEEADSKTINLATVRAELESL